MTICIIVIMVVLKRENQRSIITRNGFAATKQILWNKMCIAEISYSLE